MEPDIIRGATNNDLREVQKALKADTNCILKQDYHGDSAIHIACRLGNFSMVEFLVAQAGADISQKNRNGLDPIDTALLTGHAQIISLLFRIRAEQLDLITADQDNSARKAQIIRFDPK